MGKWLEWNQLEVITGLSPFDMWCQLVGFTVFTILLTLAFSHSDLVASSINSTTSPLLDPYSFYVTQLSQLAQENLYLPLYAADLISLYVTLIAGARLYVSFVWPSQSSSGSRGQSCGHALLQVRDSGVYYIV